LPFICGFVFVELIVPDPDGKECALDIVRLSGCSTDSHTATMDQALELFYGAALTAGSILSGFIGTFLNFRIQRDASYFRSQEGQARNQQHFTSSFLLI
jgi:hypothetical protein